MLERIRVLMSLCSRVCVWLCAACCREIEQTKLQERAQAAEEEWEQRQAKSQRAWVAQRDKLSQDLEEYAVGLQRLQEGGEEVHTGPEQGHTSEGQQEVQEGEPEGAQADQGGAPSEASADWYEVHILCHFIVLQL